MIENDPRVMWPWNGYDPAPMDGVEEHGIWFGPADRPRFGWLTMPTTRTSALGVVLCPPIGEEARAAHRTFRRLGSELARQGIVALRVDYDGTGDSAGGQEDAGRVDAWRASIADAADSLRKMGLPEIALVGMRMGATLGAEIAALGEIGSVVLWDPCTTGRGYLREGQALHALGEHVADPAEEGAIHTPGFRFDATTVRDLQAVKLATLPPTRWCERLLVLTRTGEPIIGPAAVGLAGDHVEWGQALGQLQLVAVEPNQARTPLEMIERIVGWLGAAADPQAAVPVVIELSTEATMVESESGVTIRERIVSLGSAGLFGIVSEPLEPAADAPWIVMVNVAIELHIGPGRRWVDYSRAWAALGLRCLRFDQSGAGDSPQRAEQREDTIFDPYWLVDVPEAIDALEPGSAPVAVFGLCSGAYSAFEAAMRRSFDVIYAVSPRVSVPQMARHQEAWSPDRIAARPFVRPLARLFHWNTKAAWGLWRIYRQVAVWHAPMAAMVGVLRTGATVRILADRKDAEGFREVIWWSVVRRRMIRRTGRYQLRVAPDIDHALMTQRAQRLTYADATRFWTERYGLRSGAVLPLGDPGDVGVARAAGQ